MTIWERTETTPQSLASPRNMLDWAQRSRSFEAILAGALLAAAPAAIPQDLLPPGVVIAFDWRGAVFCVVATIAVALLFTLASSAQVTELTAPREGVPSGRRMTDRSSRTREALVVGPVATALGAMLFGVRPFDAPTFTLVLIVLAVAAVLSVVGPALRATRIDRVGALRSD